MSDDRPVWRLAAFVWFIALTGFVLVPSLLVLIKMTPETSIEVPPSLPQPPQAVVAPHLDSSVPDATQQAMMKTYEHQVDVYKQQVVAYTQETNAYTGQISAYKAYAEGAKVRQTAAYTLVVKDTLTPLLKDFLAALLAYIFVKSGTQVVQNFLRLKKGEPINDISLP